MKSLEINNLKIEIKELNEKMFNEWVEFKKNGGEGGAENYKKWELTNPTALKLVNLNKELKSLKWVEDEIEKVEDLKREKEEVEELELAKNEFWITTPNYNSMSWGSKTVKLNFVDDLGESWNFEAKINDKVVKLGNDWFKIVKLNTFPYWLSEREREREREQN